MILINNSKVFTNYFSVFFVVLVSIALKKTRDCIITLPSTSNSKNTLLHFTFQSTPFSGFGNTLLFDILYDIYNIWVFMTGYFRLIIKINGKMNFPVLRGTLKIQKR